MSQSSGRGEHHAKAYWYPVNLRWFIHRTYHRHAVASVMTWNPSVLALAGAIMTAGFTIQPAPVIQTGRYISVFSNWQFITDTATGATYRWNIQAQTWDTLTYAVPR